MKIRYFDHAATTSVDEEVLNTMIPYFSENYGNPSSLYSIGKENKEAISLARMKIATILNCKVNEIYFTSGGTESDNMILKGIAFANQRFGNHIITSKIEHPAILNTCRFLEKFGFRITYLTPNSKGIISVSDVERAITRSTILISIMYANNEVGTIQPIDKIGKLAQKYGIYFHTDSVQAVGNEKINIKKSNIGSLSISGHKFYGPKGIGIAYINEKINFIRMQDGGHQERDKRGGTENVPSIIGISKALEIANNNIDSYNRKLRNLRDYYVSEVQKRIPNIRINGDMNLRLSGNANISFSGVDGSKLVEMLADNGICTSSGSACSAGFVNSSHVLLAMGMPNFLAKSALRVTFGKENTIEDTKFLLDTLEESVIKLRRI